jgi:hypothetical protein
MLPSGQGSEIWHGLGSLGMQQPFWQEMVTMPPGWGCGQSLSVWQMPNEGSHMPVPPPLPPQVSQHSPGIIAGGVPSGQTEMSGQ